MIKWSNDDFEIPKIKELFEKKRNVERKIFTLYVYGAKNRENHPKYTAYISNYKYVDRLRDSLKFAKIQFEEAVGVFAKGESSEDAVSLGFNKNLREEKPELCAKIVWFLHATQPK